MRDPAAIPAFSSDERLAFGMAVAVHVVLITALAIGAPGRHVIPPPHRMTVTFSDTVGLKSTSPEPNAQSLPDVGPQRGEQPDLAPEPPLPMTPPVPEAKPSAAPPPEAKGPAPAPKKAAPAKPAAPPPRDERPRRRPDAPEGGSLIGKDFLRGVPGSKAIGTSHNPPADAIGPAVISSLSSSIARQLKPNWIAPQGVDADKLVTVLTWDLNPDGSLAGRPRVVEQTGITPSNRAQAGRHAELAIRAVELAAPFDLPKQYYNAWKHVSAFRFDRKLSQ